MKILKKKKLLFGTLALLILIVVPLVLLNNPLSSKKAVKVLNYGFSICTQDVPSSSCGPYEVNVQSADGKKITYKVAGFDNRDSKRYDEITSTIAKAKEQNTAVTLKVNNKGFITAVEQ